MTGRIYSLKSPIVEGALIEKEKLAVCPGKTASSFTDAKRLQFSQEESHRFELLFLGLEVASLSGYAPFFFQIVALVFFA